MWIDGEKNSDQAQLLAGATQFEAMMQIPDPKAVGLGEMKSLYLACCVIAGEILSGETAERVRADLVAVRDNRSELADRDVVDVAQWVRHIQPFEAEVTKPESRPIHQAVVSRDGYLVPAVGWPNYTCEAPFGDSPRFRHGTGPDFATSSESYRAECTLRTSPATNPATAHARADQSSRRRAGV